MFGDLENDLKKVFLAGIGAIAMTAEKSEALVKELVKKGELTVEQGKALNEELKHKIRETRAGTSTPAVDVDSMTREERDALRRKLEELDAQDGE